MNSSHLIYIADVYCPWCFGFGPIMLRISKERPEFPVTVIGGNLISRPITLQEDGAQSPGLADFWREVEKTTGRSLAGAINALENGENPRMFSPGADEILAVLRKLAPGHELEQLLDLENMFYGEGLDLFTEESLTRIAKTWNISPNSLEGALDQPSTLAITERNLETAARLMGEITSYPSVLLKHGNKIDAVSRGYVHYETVLARLQDVLRDSGLEPVQSENHTRHHARSTGKRANALQ